MSEGSSGIGFSGPILPGKEEKWRRFVQEIEGSRKEEYKGLMRRLGIQRQRLWIVRARRGANAVSYLECEEPGSIATRLASSTHPFDVWLKDKLSEFHGCDFTRLDSGWIPELVFEAAENEDKTLDGERDDGEREA